MKEAFLALETAAKKLGLNVNEAKTKYMRIGGGNMDGFIEIGPYKFERVNSFVYLGSELNSHNDISKEIQRRITAANRCFFGLSKHFRSRFLSNRTKVTLYKTLVRPVLTYGSEAWATTKNDEERVAVFERRVLRRIYGPTREGDHWRLRKNQELLALYGDVDVVKFIKIGRLRWAGHVARMSPDQIPAKVMTGELHGTRRVGRPRVRWLDRVTADSRNLLNTPHWRTAAQDRNNWRKLLEEAQTR